MFNPVLVIIGFLVVIVVVALLVAARDRRTRTQVGDSDIDEFGGRRDAVRAFEQNEMLRSQARGQGHNQGGSGGTFHR